MPAVPLGQDPSHPGPAMYAVPYYNIGKHSRKASMHRRHRDVQSPLSINIKNSNPGPGAYDEKGEINRYGVYNVSHLRNSLAANWSPSARFDDPLRHSRHLPGPGTYREVDCISNKSMKYVNSLCKSPSSMRYKGDSRPKGYSSTNHTNTPGPGAYAADSGFGNTQKLLKSDLLHADSTLNFQHLNNTAGKIRSTTRSSFTNRRRRYTTRNSTNAGPRGTAPASPTRVATSPDGGFFSSKSMLDNSPY